MKPKEITYKRLFNLGGYENVTFEVTATLDAGENVDFTVLRQVVDREFNKLYKKTQPQ